MKCPICKASSWENVDQYRIKPVGMSLCTGCGFVTYPQRYKTKEQVFEYYRKEYRGRPPQVQNLYTGQTKLHYHEHFLGDLVKQWIVDGKQDPVVCDTGAAFGLFLAWWRNVKDKDGKVAFPKGEFLGTELTTSFRRVAYHEFGLTLTEEFDTSKQYDLISSYKVAEHIFDIDEELARYRDALKPGGKLYISVPTWFYRMHNFGATGWDIEYYYHPDHVNAWTRGHFERLLSKTGFRILKEDHDIYDSTYLCDVNPEKDVKAVEHMGPAEVRTAMQRIFQAHECAQKRQFDEALQHWPNFPVARRAAYEYRRAEYHKRGYAAIKAEVIEPWLAMDPGYNDALALASDLALRYLQFDDAIMYSKRALDGRPLHEVFLTQLGNIYRTKAKYETDPQKKYQAIASARDCMRMIKNAYLQGFANATTWMYNDHAQLPMPGE